MSCTGLALAAVSHRGPPPEQTVGMSRAYGRGTFFAGGAQAAGGRPVHRDGGGHDRAPRGPRREAPAGRYPRARGVILWPVGPLLLVTVVSGTSSLP
jgi:hypothetical protein